MLRIGTRRSQLALWQTNYVAGLLREAWPDLACEIVTFVTEGDKTLDKPLPEIGGKGLFTVELERGLFSAEIDIAIHSLKDLPVTNPEGLTLGAIIGRADPRDVLIAQQNWTLGSLPLRAIVGTSSLRRKAQLLMARPDLDVRSIRGNVETRISKVFNGDYHAIVLAAAGVTRLGLESEIAQYLPLDVMLPAPGQGALGVQCRADDQRVLDYLAAITAHDVRTCVVAERTFLHALAGGCATPVGAYASLDQGTISLQTLVASPDGLQEIELQGEGRDPILLGEQLAQKALARGASAILKK